jgi:hypothetical protein
MYTAFGSVLIFHYVSKTQILQKLYSTVESRSLFTLAKSPFQHIKLCRVTFYGLLLERNKKGSSLTFFENTYFFPGAASQTEDCKTCLDTVFVISSYWGGGGGQRCVGSGSVFQKNFQSKYY